ncbi:MAG: AraC family transcriptional regulator [Clostridiaceae bacterium]|nr:AraC family transcriptional regulator [Clostridiaceae bacterium]
MLETLSNEITCLRNSTRNPMDNVKMDFHLHDSYEIYLFLSGGVRYFIEKNSYDLVPGDILLMRPDEIHKATFTSNETYERIVVNFSENVLRTLSTEENELDYCYSNRPHGEKNRLNSTDDEKNELLALFDKLIMFNTYEKKWNVQLKLSVFLELLVRINRIFSDDRHSSPTHLNHQRLIPILEYIDRNLHEDLSLKSLQDKFYISGSHLCQIFKQATGSTLHEYIIYKRISKAKRLLINGESAYGASLKCGFSDYSNFFRAFRKVTGYSPREYLKQITKQ